MSWIERNTGNKNGIPTGGVGYVIMPTDGIDIPDYIQKCYRENEVMISGDGFGVMSHVKVADGIMPHIKFPKDEDGKGSMVVWLRESFYNRPIVVGTLTDNDTAVITGQGQGKDVQEFLGTSVGTFTDAVNGILNFFASGRRGRPVKILLKAIGSNDDDVEICASSNISNISKVFTVESTEGFNIYINNGEKQIITIEGDSEKFRFYDFRGNELLINNYDSSEDDEYEGEEIKKYIQLKDTFGREYIFNKDTARLLDQFGNEAILNKDNIQFKCKKFNVGSGNEHMVLGDTLKDLLEQLISAITAITVPTPHGTSGTPLNSAQLNQIKSQLSKILSQLSNTD